VLAKQAGLIVPSHSAHSPKGCDVEGIQRLQARGSDRTRIRVIQWISHYLELGVRGRELGRRSPSTGRERRARTILKALSSVGGVNTVIWVE